MTAAQADLQIDRPAVADGAALWRIARDSKTLDLNSSYSYLLWCRDFAATSAVARDETGQPVGFVTGYTRPERPRTLLVWQVAVDEAFRDPQTWWRRAIMNTAKVGWFSSDRTIRDYANEIWGALPKPA